MENTRIVFFGTPEFALNILKALLASDYHIVAAVSQPDRPSGRKHKIVPTPVHMCCIEHDIPCLQPQKLSDAREELVSLKPDLIITCAYGQFIPTSILEIPPKGCLNIHPSLLPKYRGGAPMHHAIMNGETETGVSLMEMIRKMDAGRVYAQSRTKIGPDETEQELSERLNKDAIALLLENLPKYLEGELEGIEQDESKVIIGNNITAEEEHVIFHDEDIHTAYNHIRGLIDWPFAYGTVEGKRMKFLKVRKEIQEIDQEPGTVLGFRNGAMEIACRGGILRVLEMQPEGKKKMDANAYKNGYANEIIGKVFD